jgi:hypothetical protein
VSHRLRIGFKLSFCDVAPVKATLERLVDFNEHYIKLSVEFMLNDKLLDFANCLTTNQTTVVPARCDGWEGERPVQLNAAVISLTIGFM